MGEMEQKLKKSQRILYLHHKYSQSLGRARKSVKLEFQRWIF